MKQATSRILFALAVAAIPLSASADNAFTMRDVEVYTGPGSEYPPVATLPPNTAVEIAGCLSDWSWCDINFADSRGWVYAADLGYPYQNNRVVIIEYGPRLGIPVVAFSLPAYWDAHYRGRPWYRERDVWVNRVHAQVDRGGRPPQGRAAVTAQPSPGAAAPPPSGQAQPPQRPQAAQPAQAPPQSQSQTTQPSPQSGTRSQQAGQAPQSMPAPQAAQSLQSASPPEGRPPAGRPPEGRPPEGRPPESAGRPEPAGRPEAGPPSERGGQQQGKGQQEGRGQQEGKGPPEGRGAGGPDRDKQQ